MSEEAVPLSTEGKYGMIGISPGIQAVYRDLDRLTNAPDKLVPSVFINGESGTGKELVARALYRFGPRGKQWGELPHPGGNRQVGQQFVAFNCAGVPADLAEATFFGYRKGSFTGASSHYKGLFAQASGGVLFLDEVTELPYQMQAKLLRILQEGMVRPIGGEERRVDVKLVTASSRSLDEAVKAGEFRSDLRFRMNGYVINVPPLRERREDIPLLVDHFLDQWSNELETAFHIDDRAVALMAAYSWPGNVRELENTVQALLLHAGEDGIVPYETIEAYLVQQMRIGDEEVAEAEIACTGGLVYPHVRIEVGEPWKGLVARTEVAWVEAHLEETSGNVAAAARLVGQLRPNFAKKVDRASGTAGVDLIAKYRKRVKK